ncbi:hypothetical protein PoB_004068700 [Plakobranchus ocellatus]|uniref:Uncharacterized protein n=1 Tax=Plakobranchus ocellatus TaxID=259542 RepID=A0AAV4B3S9_9GAST|nr:hypothetical protein PoB_004068700 [Plakobranchus ocellatus]
MLKTRLKQCHPGLEQSLLFLLSQSFSSPVLFLPLPPPSLIIIIPLLLIRIFRSLASSILASCRGNLLWWFTGRNEGKPLGCRRAVFFLLSLLHRVCVNLARSPSLGTAAVSLGRL